MICYSLPRFHRLRFGFKTRHHALLNLDNASRLIVAVTLSTHAAPFDDMRVWPLLCALGAVTWAAVIGELWLNWQPWLTSFAGPSSRAPLLGLVQVEDVLGPEAPDYGEADALARVTDSSPARSLFTGLSDALSALLRLPQLRQQLALQAEELLIANGRAKGDAGDDPEHLPVDDIRVLVQKSLLRVALALKLMGFSLVLLLPMSIAAYWLLRIQPHVVPSHFQPIFRLFDSALTPPDQLLKPVLLSAARVFGLSNGYVLCEESDDLADGIVQQVSKRAQRVLLALLVLNVAASALAVLALACLVAVVRGSGIMNI
eukprot:gnl/TRDRNA2_/TRDRNA2_186874_c0_seq1.p1 gnl/TRDRNA2_/TRDRNA2_186874_c0~~gnl/TRDRNA2_/TRDRNA2_186874_c0_seq1.p1  ORF type:complete len:316 (+),score=44.00 gnl/TRDRNA2_/TRDRNA2_186874_c0_seq1:11-958(+)